MRTLLRALGLPAVALAAGFALPASFAGADSFTPVTMSIAVTPLARLQAPLQVTVGIKADPGVLDTGEGPLRVEVKLAPVCGGDFQHTDGVTLINLALNPQPTTGKAYSGSVTNYGLPLAYGVQRVCAYLEDSTVGRVYANDESLAVNVSHPCTAAGRRYDSAARALAHARRQYRRAHGRKARHRAAKRVTRSKRTLARDRRLGTAVCGAGVPL
ncbi:MAG: hypothetical protein M3010_11795 [Candidatus Dormibacteraeota bacterium]|nr:hypothetical protein [Candidatus Dormibacteraeota bacterium]